MLGDSPARELRLQRATFRWKQGTKGQHVTVLELIQRSTAFLQEKGIETPRLQIELMLGAVLKLPRLKLYLNFERVLVEEELDRLREMVRRRAAHEPLQHILGSTSFCGLEIKCSPAALIPRPETELLAERAWQFLGTLISSASGSEPPRALEIGTGTGCIAIAMAVHAPLARIHAVDISPEALALARQNAAAHQVDNRIEFHLGDALAGPPAGAPFDLMVSNPPYIPSGEIVTLQAEVRDFDPRLALDGGSDGLDFYRRFSGEASPLLKAGGRIMLEFGDGQAEDVKKIFESQKWIVEAIVPDYSARPRILTARRSD